MKILTIGSAILKQPTQNIKDHEFDLAQEVGHKLRDAILPFLPAAGLAAPQIGVNKSIFIYSYDRDPEHLEVAINPHFTPIGEATYEDWEGCLSVISTQYKLAKVKRYKKIHASYQCLNREKRSVILEGFAARVFQHECDHLEGVINIFKSDTIVKEFFNENDLRKFLKNVKKDDSKLYIKPIIVKD